MVWAALAAVICVGMIVWRTEAVVRDLAARHFDVREAETQRMAATPIPEPIPADIAMAVERETEPWAREQMRAALRDQYAETGSWDAVRTYHFGAEQ